MLDEQLDRIQELETYGDKYKAELAFGKLPDGRFSIVCDFKGRLDQSKKGLVAFFRQVPIMIVFNKKNDLTILDKVDKPVDTQLFQGSKAQKLFRSMKIISRGSGNVEGRYDTVAIRKINLKPFKPNSVLVVRLDSYSSSQISKTTREVPANVYYRAKGDTKGLMKEEEKPRPIKEFIDPISIATTALVGFVLSLAMIFGMLGLFIASAKRDKKREKELKTILKDGKDWKVYIIKEDSPNAFCIATPRMFIHTGLIKILTDEEVMAVMLHEAGHIKHHDMWKNFAAQHTFMGMLVALAFATAGSAAAPGLAIALMVMMVMHILGIQHKIFALTLGRKGERSADSMAVKYGYGSQMASALQKLEKWITGTKAKRPCGRTCQIMGKVDAALDEHPPLKKRVETVLKEKETWEAKNLKSMGAARMFFSKKLGVEDKK